MDRPYSARLERDLNSTATALGNLASPSGRPGSSVCLGQHGAPQGGTRVGLAPTPPQLL